MAVFAGSDMDTQLICAVVIQHHPISHDGRHFPELFQQMMIVAVPWIFVLDKGYDAEWVHQMIQDQNILSVIPVRNRGLSCQQDSRQVQKADEKAILQGIIPSEKQV